MRYFLTAAAYFGMIAYATAADPNDLGNASGTNLDSDPLTVMTWNLEWFFDDDPSDNHSDLAKQKTSPSRSQWEWKRDAVAESVAQVRPSILALQEVESRRVLWYLTRAIARNHQLEYREMGIESRDHYTEEDARKPA